MGNLVQGIVDLIAKGSVVNILLKAFKGLLAISWPPSSVDTVVQDCWNYKVMGSQRRYLEGLIDDKDDADDEY